MFHTEADMCWFDLLHKQQYTHLIELECNLVKRPVTYRVWCLLLYTCKAKYTSTDKLFTNTVNK